VDVIKPRNIIEHIYVYDVAQIAWEIARLRSCKTVIINTAYRTALKDLLNRELGVDYQTAEALAGDWFTDKEAKKQVAEILRRFHLNESAIEAEAIKSLVPELDILDRMSMSLEGRRNRAIRGIAEYRESFAKKVREGSDRIIEGDPAIRLENLHGEKSA
jgi:hypothetical protein